MASLSDGFLTLPGGYGTLEEFFETLTWAQLGLHTKPCALLDVAGFWDDLLAMVDTQIAAGFVPDGAPPADPELATIRRRFSIAWRFMFRPGRSTRCRTCRSTGRPFIVTCPNRRRKSAPRHELTELASWRPPTETLHADGRTPSMVGGTPAHGHSYTLRTNSESAPETTGRTHRGQPMRKIPDQTLWRPE